MGSSGVYRTGSGLVFRVTEEDGGPPRVEVLRDGTWTPGRVGMVGLRLAGSTRRLDEAAILALPR